MTSTPRLVGIQTDCADTTEGRPLPGQCSVSASSSWHVMTEARAHLDQARKLGLGDNTELIHVMRYHDGLLSILKGDFEKAQETLGSLSYEGLKSEELIISLGLAILRIGMTPKEITIDYPDRSLIRRAGLAEHFAAEKNMSDAQREYDMVVRDYGKVANVQYAYGRFLLVNRDDDGAQAAFQRELKTGPNTRWRVANLPTSSCATKTLRVDYLWLKRQ